MKDKQSQTVLSPPIANFVRNAGFETIEKFEEYLIEGRDGQKYFQNTGQMEIIVTGGSNNNYFSIGGMRCARSVSIGNWRQLLFRLRKTRSTLYKPLNNEGDPFGVPVPGGESFKLFPKLAGPYPALWENPGPICRSHCRQPKT